MVSITNFDEKARSRMRDRATAGVLLDLHPEGLRLPKENILQRQEHAVVHL
jgi:hypothetical protein